RQKGPYGNGTPVLCSKSVVGDEPFAVLWGDEFHYAPEKPRLKQLIEAYEKYQDPVITAYPIDDEGTKKYGVVEGQEVENDIYQVKTILEKPGPEKTESRLGSIGGYVLTPDIFEALEDTKVGRDGELWLVDAIFKLSKKRPIYARKVDSTYYDTGSKFGYLRANVDFALRDKEMGEEFGKYLKSVI
ncbi:UTP--glucose-1-phosphate uridylyltransferase, partial [Patescibacteria group bacterium]|nr:UTP--glucose-1-phosphate uridylyltransferase [Patescibacteria group bacterium]